MRAPSYRAACAAAAALTVAAYANHFGNSFHFDDSHAIDSNQFLRSLRNVPRYFTDARTFSALPSNQSYRPVVTTTLALDYALGGGLHPVAFHVDSFLWFLLQCGLMLALFRRVLRASLPDEPARADWLALFGAALYAVHAAIAETVNYVIARSDILSTLGAVAALFLWDRFPRARRFGLYLVPAVLGVLAKEQGAMLAPLLLVHAALVEHQLSIPQLLAPRRLWGALRAALPAFAACGGALALTLRMAPAWTPGGASRWHYLLTQPFVLLHYAGQFVLPLELTADTDWTAVESAHDPRVWIGLPFVIAALWVAVRASRSQRARPVAYGIAWFFVALVPTSSVVPLAEVTNDHRMYFPFVGLALAAASGAGLLLRRLPLRGALARAPAAAAALILVAHAAGTHARNRVWRTEETLWRDVTQKSPANARGWMNYGLARMAVGDYDEAERCFEKGLQLAPRYGYLHVNLAIARGARGDAVGAEQHFRAALALMPGVPSFRFYYARWLAQVGRAAEAVPLLREALALSPGEAQARALLLKTLADLRDWSALAEAAQQALRIEPGDEAARSLLQLAQKQQQGGAAPLASPLTAAALVERSLREFQEGRYEAVLQSCDQALALRPDLAEAWNNKCAAFNVLRRFREAADACERALRLKPDFERARNNLAIARQSLRGQ